MTFNEYQKSASKTAIYPPSKGFEYLATGLAAEAGEVAGLIAKAIRGDYIGVGLDKGELIKELGDVLWFIAEFATEIDVDLEKIAEQNLVKLEDRQKRGKIQGNGNNR